MTLTTCDKQSNGRRIEVESWL